MERPGARFLLEQAVRLTMLISDNDEKTYPEFLHFIVENRIMSLGGVKMDGNTLKAFFLPEEAKKVEVWLVEHGVQRLR